MRGNDCFRLIELNVVSGLCHGQPHPPAAHRRDLVMQAQKRGWLRGHRDSSGDSMVSQVSGSVLTEHHTHGVIGDALGTAKLCEYRCANA